MTKRSYFILVVLISALFNSACSPSVSNKQSGARKFFVQPVCLSVTGIERDTSIRRLFEEVFAKHKVQLVTQDEMRGRVEVEGRRMQQKLLLKKEELKGKAAEEIMKAAYDEMKYVSNMLSIRLEIHEKDDSLMIYKVSWSNMPIPPKSNRLEGTNRREINLSNHSYSIKENVISIVDSILYSKELK